VVKVRKRKGIALITVLLISALVFSSIVAVVLKVVPEKAMSNAQSASQRALTAAEACISQIAFDLRNSDIGNNVINPPSAYHYLTINDVKKIVKNPVGYVFTPEKGEVQFTPSPDTFYVAKIKRISKGDVDQWDPDIGLDGDKIVYIGVYALAKVKQNGNVVAQKAVYTEMAVSYHKKTKQTDITPPNSAVFQYGIFSGSDIAFNGNAQEVAGNVFADGNIDLGPAKGKIRIAYDPLYGGGSAYAVGSITGKGVAEVGAYYGQNPIEFPMLNIPYYQALAQAFKTGQKPYDGTVQDYPKTNDPVILAIIQNYLGTGANSTLNQISTFYNDLVNKTGAFAGLDPIKWQQLKTNAKNIVYYIDGDVHISGNVKLQGTIVINGNLIINGNSTVDNDGALAMLVNGNVELANGNALLKGIFYTTGSFTGNGTFDCYGAIVSKGAVNLNGTYRVYYRPVDMKNLSIVGTPGNNGSVTNIITACEQQPNAWREISVDDFNNATNF
jgi:cytoskeletal protein CcmA (bactofilin family)